MNALIELDLYIGVSAFNLRTYHSTKIVSEIPLDRLVLASNSPFSDHKSTAQSLQHIRTLFKEYDKNQYDPNNEEHLKIVVNDRNEPCKLV
jgi:Tat protein secretion system quality control protein TatD with DNase activity